MAGQLDGRAERIRYTAERFGMTPVDAQHRPLSLERSPEEVEARAQQTVTALRRGLSQGVQICWFEPDVQIRQRVVSLLMPQELQLLIAEPAVQQQEPWVSPAAPPIRDSNRCRVEDGSLRPLAAVSDGVAFPEM